jgi:mitochondrial fission protein ELM1
MRDKSRMYEIYLMKRLSGFNLAGWRTGFTNYRFAVPELAGRQGRAIYNDVDQVYAADPGELFDQDLDGHGFLAVSDQDTSVMLIDCARMSKFWSASAAMSLSKMELLAVAARNPGLWGPLEPNWNARDLEYVEGRSKLLHFTALHLQPWQPFPREYSYHPHPLAHIWLRLERAANAEGFLVFDEDRPSMEFRHVIEDNHEIRGSTSEGGFQPCKARFDTLPGVKSAVQIGLGIGPELQVNRSEGGVLTVNQIDISAGNTDWHVAKCDLSIAMRLLELVPSEDIPWLIARMFKIAKQQFCAVVQCFEGEPRDEQRGPVKCARDSAWWLDRIGSAAARFPHIAWDLLVLRDTGSGRAVSESYRFRPKTATATERSKVWVLTSGRTGDRAQLIGLAEQLGWPIEVKQLRYNVLSLLPNFLLGATRLTLKTSEFDIPNNSWPDLILDCGRRSVPIARWIRSRSNHTSRWVHLGRPWAPIKWFDLVVSTPQYRVLQRPNVMQIALPFHLATAERLAQAGAGWEQRLNELPKPWIAVLVGGNSTSHVFDERTARLLGESASAAAIEAGGSLLVTTSPRTTPASASALKAALSAPNFFHAWDQGQTENPYLAFLALADRIVVTGDSASMIAEACSTGRPVSLFELPKRPNILTILLGVTDKLARICGIERNYRGTLKQQSWLARTFDRLVEMGVFMPTRDMAAMHQILLARGMVERLGENFASPTTRRQDDYVIVIDRIRTLMSLEQTSYS